MTKSVNSPLVCHAGTAGPFSDTNSALPGPPLIMTVSPVTPEPLSSLFTSLPHGFATGCRYVWQMTPRERMPCGRDIGFRTANMQRQQSDSEAATVDMRAGARGLLTIWWCVCSMWRTRSYCTAEDAVDPGLDPGPRLSRVMGLALCFRTSQCSK